MSEPVEKALGFLCTPSAEHMSDGQRIDEFCHIGRKTVGEITIMRAMLAANEAEIARLREALKNARADALKEGAEIAFAYNGMPRSEIAQAFARAARGESDE